MIGQEELVNIFESFTIDTLPRTMLVLGEKGCGKKTLIFNHLLNRLKLNVIDLSNCGSIEDLRNAFDAAKNSVILSAILVNLDALDTRSDAPKQNAILKFIEEPSPNINIILYAESELGILETILNRCKTYKFKQYTETQLRDITRIDNDLIFKIYSTPGKIINADLNCLKSTFELCNKIVKFCSKASFPNTLSIVNKINFKEDYNKIDFELFFNVLKYCAFNNYLETSDDISYYIYNFTAKNYSKYLFANNPNKEYFAINFLTNLWEDLNEIIKTKTTN